MSSRLLSAIFSLLLTAGMLVPGAALGEVRLVTEPDGTVRITNRSRSDRPRARVVVEDGVMTVRLGAGARVVPQADRGQYDHAFEASAARWDLPVALVKAVAMAESAFDPRAESTVGARGLMQLMPATGRAMGVTDFFDPVQSIEGGSRYLRKMLDRFEELELALAAYNAGPDAVVRYDGIPPFKETRRYVRRVMALYEAAQSADLPQPES
ncbi:MAG: lytic transglycosylase domain-containing protein [Myxococcota bacterium]